MGDLSFKYIADMERDMVVLQGISAQIRRVERRELEPWHQQRRRKCDSLQMVPLSMAAIPVLRPATASGSSAKLTAVTPSPPQITARRQRQRSRTAGNVGSPSIPLRLLLPKCHSSSVVQRCKLPADTIAADHGFGPADAFGDRNSTPLVVQSSPLASPASINPRFSDAHFEYIDNDCVIHNGMQMVDIGLEYATQRAAPRLISL
ncbi:hypothetical protein LPJ59_002814 [Coemansia sp. RSA 2399]|nr:hypothetical protein LPJ59_002814 [Coemansia sp. RSA 2399]KAJ1894495.1 hypothetical protein LPJ81_005147 [Coemansia sp. IMI 209127]